jgi:hypothetical protein
MVFGAPLTSLSPYTFLFGQNSIKNESREFENDIKGNKLMTMSKVFDVLINGIRAAKQSSIHAQQSKTEDENENNTVSNALRTVHHRVFHISRQIKSEHETVASNTKHAVYLKMMRI